MIAALAAMPLDPAAPHAFTRLVRVLTLQGGHNAAVVLLGVALLGIASGIVGSFAMLRRRALMADALSHATLPGICLAFLIAPVLGLEGRSLAVLLPGAAATGILALLAVHWAVRHTRLTEDAAIGAALSVFFAVGIVLLTYIQGLHVGNQGGLGGFIFGQTATMHASDAWLIAVVAAGASAIAVALFRQLGLVCFDDQFAASIGLRVHLIDLTLMSMVVVVTVVGLQAVGLILVIALLIVPPAAARLWTDRLAVMVILAALFGGLSASFGAAVSASFDRTPAGPAIVLTAGTLFLLSALAAPRRGIVAGLLRHASFQRRIQLDHALRSLHTPSAGRPHITSAARRTLLRRGLAVRAGGGSTLTLTDAGRAAAALVDRNRRLWEHYLVTRADVAPSHVDLSADAIEHVLSPELVAALESEMAQAPLADDRPQELGA